MKSKELEIDFEADTHVAASDDQLRAVAVNAQKMLNLQQAIDKAEAWLTDKKGQLRIVQEVDLVNAMDACNMAAFTLDSGQQVIIKQICAGSIPKDKLPEALMWLRKNKFDSIIKRKIEVSLGRGMDKLGAQAVAALKKMGLEVTENETVHPQTLGAWAREIIEAGKVTLPLETLGLFVGRKAIVK